MVSTVALFIFACALLLNIAFSVWWYRTKRETAFLNKLFLLLAFSLSTWIVPVMCIYFVKPENTPMMYFLDCLMQEAETVYLGTLFHALCDTTKQRRQCSAVTRRQI